MKKFNYLIVLAVYLFLSAWTFNHVNVWVGIGMVFVAFYAVLYKVVILVKGKMNEKS